MGLRLQARIAGRKAALLECPAFGRVWEHQMRFASAMNQRQCQTCMLQKLNAYFANLVQANSSEGQQQAKCKRHAAHACLYSLPGMHWKGLNNLLQPSTHLEACVPPLLHIHTCTRRMHARGSAVVAVSSTASALVMVATLDIPSRLQRGLACTCPQVGWK